MSHISNASLESRGDFVVVNFFRGGLLELVSGQVGLVNYIFTKFYID